jgi:hypothetical protein
MSPNVLPVEVQTFGIVPTGPLKFLLGYSSLFQEEFERFLYEIIFDVVLLAHFVWDLHHHVLGVMRVVFPQIYFLHFTLSNLNFVVVNQNQIGKAGSGNGDGP